MTSNCYVHFDRAVKTSDRSTSVFSKASVLVLIASTPQ